MLPDAGRHDEAIHEAWPFDPHLLIAVLCKGGCGGGELYTIRDIQRIDMRHSKVGEAPPHQIGASRAVVGKVKLSSLQHIALTRLASQPDWCEAEEIGTAPVIIGRLRANGLVDRLPTDRLRTHRQRYRINAAGLAALEGWISVTDEDGKEIGEVPMCAGGQQRRERGHSMPKYNHPRPNR